MASPIRILLVEDEPAWQEGIRVLLATDPDLSLVAVTDTFDGAVAAYEANRPEIALLDWQIVGEKDGLAVGAWLEAQGMPTHRILLISGAPASTIPPHPYLAVPKPRLASELVMTIRSVAANL